MKLTFEVLYDQGTARSQEDALIVNPPFFGVADGVSGLYPYGKKPMAFRRLTGGQMVCREIRIALSQANHGTLLEDALDTANSVVRTKVRKAGISEEQVELMPGAVFALAKIDEEEAQIVQAGDCFAVLLFNDGGIWATRNQCFRHDARLLQRISELMKKHQGNRIAMWKEFSPYLAKMRRNHANNSSADDRYAILNGQKEAQELCKKGSFSAEKIRLMLLFSDGFVPFEETEDKDSLAKRVLRLYLREGLKAVLDRTRGIEERQKDKSHIDHAEATAIAIEFSR